MSPDQQGAREVSETHQPAANAPSPDIAASPPLGTTPEPVVPEAVTIASRREGGRGQRLLLIVSLSALVMSLAAVGVIGWGVYRWRSLLTRSEQVDDAEQDSSTKRANLSADDEDDEDDDARTEPPSLEDVIKETHTEALGTLEVVDVGLQAGGLTDFLRAQRLVAETKGQTMVLMLTGRRCEPCRSFDGSLEHPLMQRALKDVRLVRVDLEVFKEELKRMELPTSHYPAFFLLGDDLRPLDAIHGGEWDDDVAENIAPVIGPFIRGELHERRHYDWSPTTSSIPI